MKKIFTCIIIIVSAFLFYDIYNKYQTLHEDNLYGIESINNKFNNIVTFEQTIYENNKEFINDLSILADKYKVTVVKLDSDEERRIYQYYLYSHEDIQDLCDVIVDKKIDFDDVKQKNYYSNLEKNKNVVPMFSMGKNMILNIKPISYLYNNHDVVGDYCFIGDDQAITSFLKELNVKYPIKRNESYEMDEHESDTNNNQVSMNTTMFVVCVIIFLLIIVGWLIKNKKTHTIYYLNGISVKEIVKDLYLKTFLLGMGFSVLVPAVLFACFVRKINVLTKMMISSLSVITLLEIISLIGILIAITVYLSVHFKLDGLYGKKSLKIFLNLNYVAKLVFLLLLMPLVVQYNQILINDFQHLHYVKSNYQGIEDYINIYTMDYHYQNFDYSLIDVINGKMNSTIQEYQDYYDLLEDNGAISFMWQPFKENIDEYIVNYQYLKHFPMMDTSGKKLSTDLNTDHCFVLVPESLKDVDIQQFSQENNMKLEKVVINNKQPHLRNLEASYCEETNDKAILFVYGKHYQRKERNPYTNIYIKKTIHQVDQIVKGSRFEGTMKWYSLDDYIKQTELRSPYYLFKNTIIIVLTVLLIIMILYENYCFYVKLNMKKVMIKKIMGLNRWMIFKELYLELLICYLPVLVLCREYIWVPVLFLLFDGLLHIYMTYYIYNVKTIYYLKGGS